MLAAMVPGGFDVKKGNVCMNGRPHINVKVEPCSTLRLRAAFHTLPLFTRQWKSTRHIKFYKQNTTMPIVLREN